MGSEMCIRDSNIGDAYPKYVPSLELREKRHASLTRFLDSVEVYWKLASAGRGDRFTAQLTPRIGRLLLNWLVSLFIKSGL